MTKLAKLLLGTFLFLPMCLANLINQRKVLNAIIKQTGTSALLYFPNFQNLADHNLSKLVERYSTKNNDNLMTTSVYRPDQIAKVMEDVLVPSLVVIEDANVLFNEPKLIDFKKHVWMFEDFVLNSFGNWTLSDDNIDSKVFTFKWNQNFETFVFYEIYNIATVGNSIKRKICKIATTIEITDQCYFGNRLRYRKDLRGHQFRVLWGNYVPYSMKTDKGDYFGIMPDLVKIMAKNMNFTLEVDEGEHWGSQFSNGSWNGMIGEIIGKRYDFAITGFSVTNERKADANFFNLPELRDMRTLLVRRPTTATITFHAYIKQFSNWLWICTIGTALANIVVIWIALMGKKHWNKELKLSDWPSQEYYPIEAVYMGIIGKKSKDMTTKQMSVRIGLLCALLMGLFLLTSYRATLNAFLAVKLYSIPISGFEDILTENYDILTYQFSSEGDIFRHAPQGSARRALYEKKLKPYPNLDMAKLGVAKSVDMVVTGDSTAIFTNMAQIRDLPQYPCRIIDVADSSVQFYVETSIPIYMDHPLKPLIDLEIQTLAESGVIDRILHKYRPPPKNDCDAPTEPLALGNTFLPFGILSSGLVASLVVVLAEFLQYLMKPKAKIQTELGHKKDFFKKTVFGLGEQRKSLEILAEVEQLLRQDHLSEMEKVGAIKTLLH